MSNERDSDRSNDTAGSDSDSDPEGNGSSAPVDAALVGLMGALTAAGGAGAAGAGAGAGAGTGTGTGTGTAGGAAGASTASTMLTNASIRTSWLRRLLTTRLADIPWELATIFRYSRYDDSDPFENDKRRTIFETIEDDPGSYLSAVSDESDIPLSTVRHHVRILEDEAMLTSVKIRGKRRYFPADESDIELHAALAEPATRRVLETLADSGSATNGRLAEELECDPSTVSHHLSRLEADGLVTRERDGRSVVTELAPAAETALLEDDISGSGATVQAPADD